MARTINLLCGTAALCVREQGTGSPVLLLHGGAGPDSMAALAAALPDRRTILPVIPGFDGTPRASWIKSVSDVATLYLAMIEELDLADMLLVGNSVGGWIAAEMAARQPDRVSALVLINAVGLTPNEDTGPIMDLFSLSPDKRAQMAFHEPSRQPPLNPGQISQLRENASVMSIYAGDPYMHDPAFETRLGEIEMPTTVLWGASDCIVRESYGVAMARLIHGAAFRAIPQAGHFPQIEQTEKVANVVQGLTAK